MLIYGRNVCEVALKENVKIRKIYLQEGFSDKKLLNMIENDKLKPTYLLKRKMDDLVNGIHQGIIFDVSDYKYADIDKLLGENKFVVMLDHLEDVHNLGAIIRTCEAAGVDAIIIPENREVLVNGSVIKTSAGCAYQMDIVKVVNLARTIDYLKSNNYWVVGTSLDTDLDYREVDYSGNICLVIGNEGKGISDLVKKNCDFLVKIPMKGKVTSLNASVSTGIIIYEALKQRM